MWFNRFIAMFTTKREPSAIAALYFPCDTAIVHSRTKYGTAINATPTSTMSQALETK